MKKKKKRGSLFAKLLVIVLLLMSACTVTANLVFSGDTVRGVFGYYLYLHEESDMEPDIPQNSLVIAKDLNNAPVPPGSKVLCYLNDGSMAMREIYQVDPPTEANGNVTLYYPGTALDRSDTPIVDKSHIFATCQWSNQPLYSYVKFATTPSGLMVMLVAPCVILIIMLLVKIVRSSTDDMDDEEFMFDEEADEDEDDEAEEEDKPKHPSAVKKVNPLFTPESEQTPSESFEKKKSSITEHFSTKPVNENSPYQKAVQERTMRFQKIQQEEEAAAAEKAAEKAAEGSAEKQTRIFPPTEEAAAKKDDAVNAAKAAAEAKPAAPANDVKSTSPNIDDLISPTELRVAKTGQKINPDAAAANSIDDLINLLENEKKKL